MTKDLYFGLEEDNVRLRVMTKDLYFGPEEDKVRS